MQIDTLTLVTDAEATIEVDSVAIRVKQPSGNQVTLTSDDSVVDLVGQDRNLNLATLRATGAITFSGTGTADDTITIGSVTYTLKAAPTAANEVDIGVDADTTAANLVAAINLSGTPDTEYGTGTVAHPRVSASADGAVVTVTALEAGTRDNTLATTEAGTGASFAAATLAGGEDLPLKAIKTLIWPRDDHAVT